jgi:hypothetical protein
VAARSKAYVCSCSPAEIMGANLPGLMNVCLLRVLCDQVHASAKGRSLVQKSPPECGVSEYDLEIATMMRPRPTRAIEFESHQGHGYLSVVSVV